jgi:hypothetical protein
MEQLGSHWTDFSRNLIFEYFSKNYPENSSFIKIGQELRVLYMKTNINFWLYLAQFFLEWDMFHTKVVGEIKTQILCAIFFFKSCRLWDNVEKYCKAGQARDDNVACWKTKATNTRTQYITLIAFPLEHWLHERAWILRCTYVGCLVKYALAKSIQITIFWRLVSHVFDRQTRVISSAVFFDRHTCWSGVW